MSWRTSRAVLLLRTAGRAIGLNRRIAAWRSRGYEDRFQSAMLAAVSTGSCVWDVGANVGLYSTQFSRLAGPSGKVFAFEPSPINLGRLRAAVTDLKNVIVMPLALGERESTVVFEQGADEFGATSRVVADATRSKDHVTVELASGDHLIASGAALSPNVIKIDTEGFELNVLRGLERTLVQPGLRALCIEVHFSLLAARGMRDAPAEIEKMLRAAEFSVAWPDSSHIVATRA